MKNLILLMGFLFPISGMEIHVFVDDTIYNNNEFCGWKMHRGVEIWDAGSCIDEFIDGEYNTKNVIISEEDKLELIKFVSNISKKEWSIKEIEVLTRVQVHVEIPGISMHGIYFLEENAYVPKILLGDPISGVANK